MEPLVRQEGEKIILKSDCCLSGCLPQIKDTGIIDKFSFCKFSMASRFSGCCLFIFCSETIYFGSFKHINLSTLLFVNLSRGEGIRLFLLARPSAIRSLAESTGRANTILSSFKSSSVMFSSSISNLIILLRHRLKITKIRFLVRTLKIFSCYLSF